MNTELMNELKELLGLFPRSYINANLEVILIPKTNTYFNLEGVQSRRDIIAKLLMWCSRTIVKGQPFRSHKRNNLFREVIKKTLNYYLQTLLDAFIFYRVDRFDVRGKQILKTLQKYYIVDLGIRNMLLGERDLDYGHVLENVVYLELLRREYKIFIGKIGEKEIDFLIETKKRIISF